MRKKSTTSQRFFLLTIRFYQTYLSPFLGPRCRFQPSCSQYCLMAIEKYGVIKGLFLTLKRLLRCQSFSQGGLDLP